MGGSPGTRRAVAAAEGQQLGFEVGIREEAGGLSRGTGG
jgi:hypothetical protein